MDRKERVLAQLDLESARKKEEYLQNLQREKLPVNEVQFAKAKRKLNYNTKSNYLNIKQIYKENLDLCNQADRDLYALEHIYNKYINGEPLPPLALKDGRYVQEEFTDKDLTDLYIIEDYFVNKYGKDLSSVIQELGNDDDELNDDDDKALVKELNPSKDGKTKEPLAKQEDPTSD